MNILVTGGAGYIGSVVVSLLQSHNVTVIDSLVKGKRELVPDSVSLQKVDLMDLAALRLVFASGNFDAVIHFAAAKDAGESMVNLTPYTQNIQCLGNVLQCMDEFGVKRIIFSSSAAVYGNPTAPVITESHPTQPINYYGYSKLACEQMLSWYAQLRGFIVCNLRYFNVAGDVLGYVDPNAKNIFPILGEVLSGTRAQLDLYGDDYDTPDGTCVRDYIHVHDLARAHVRCLDCSESLTVNLGSGQGYSVTELVAAFEAESGVTIPVRVVARREGDPAKLVCSYELALSKLGWSPELTLRDMVKSTLAVYKG